MSGTFAVLVARDLRLAARRRVDVVLPIAFFTVAVSLFPLGVGPEPQTLRQIAPGVVWVAALLAAMLSVTQLYAADHADGSLEQMLSSRRAHLDRARQGGVALAPHRPAAGRRGAGVRPALRHVAAAIASLVAGLVLGTPVLSLLGGLGAALTLGLRSGAVLLILIIVPLCIPAIIFGAGAVAAVESGLSARGHYSLLGALLIFTAVLAPMATGAALRIATE
jgi:heme exporter protein B